MNKKWNTFLPIKENADYQVSFEGEVKNIKTGCIRKLKYTRDGYATVSFYKNKKENRYLVHRLVAQFIPNPDQVLTQIFLMK